MSSPDADMYAAVRPLNENFRRRR